MNMMMPSADIHAPPARVDAQDRSCCSLAVGIEADFDFRSSEYRSLFEASGADAFRHPVWLDAFYRHLAPSRGATAAVVVGREKGSGRPVFVLPLILRRKSGVSLLETADLGVSDYASPVLRTDWQDRIAADPAIIDAVRQALPPHDLMRIRPIRSEMLAQWRLFLGGQAIALDFGAHAARLSAPYGEWRAEHLTRSFRKYLDRRKNRFLKSGDVQLTYLEAPDAALAVASIRTLRAGRFDGDPIQDDATTGFYATVAAEGAEAGFSRLYRLSLDGGPVGYVFGLTHAGRLYYLLIGCDYAAHGRHSPGLVMYDLMMEAWVGEGGDVFDFTIGDESFKVDFATTATPMFALLSTPTVVGRAGRMVFDARERARKMAAGFRKRAEARNGE